MKKNFKIIDVADKISLNIGSTNDRHPAFCFRYMDRNFGFNNLDNNNYKIFLKKIDVLSQLSWREINQSARQKNGTEKISIKQIKQNLPKEIIANKDITAFHLDGLFRIIGFREGKIYYVLFIDTKGQIYKH